MKLKFTLFLSVLLLSLTVSAQWLQRAGFPGVSKAKSTAFTIGDKIYVVGGISNSNVILSDFWEYDIPSNAWSQKPNFPGPERYGAATFVVNGKGYVATGGNDFGFLDDLWEYNPVTSSWIQRTGLPAGSAQHENQRREAYAFSIGSKGYLGGGDGWVFGPNGTWNYAFFDLWEYNPVTDSWIQKADIPDFIGRDFSIGVSLNNKGYVGLGCNVDQNLNRQSFWEYDPVTNSWTARADFPTVFTVDAGAFALNSFLYVTGGVRFTPLALSNQFYKYDPVADAWTQLSVFNGGAIAGEFAVSTGASAFVGTGYNGSIITRNDVWEFTTTTNVSESSLAADALVNVYPNPAGEYITVSVQPALVSSEYIISDLFGRTVMKGTFHAANSTIKIDELSAGLYILETGEHNRHATKFLKK